MNLMVDFNNIIYSIVKKCNPNEILVFTFGWLSYNIKLGFTYGGNRMRFYGETVDAALSKGLADLGVGRNQVEVTVISEGRKGFLGIGRRKAEVDIKVLIPNDNKIDDQYSDELEDEITDEIHESEADSVDSNEDRDEALDNALQDVGSYLQSILVRLGIDAEKSMKIEHRNIIFDFDTEQPGLLIGKHGRTLNALQVLAQSCLNKQIKQHYRIILDVEGYRQRRREQLQQISTELAQRAIVERRPFKLGPMPAMERKIVHQVLASNRHVKAKSHGNDPYRYIVIAPKMGSGRL